MDSICYIAAGSAISYAIVKSMLLDVNSVPKSKFLSWLLIIVFI